MLNRAHYLALGVVATLLLVLLNLPAETSGRLKRAVGGLFVPLFGLSGAARSFVDSAALRVQPRASLIREVQRLSAENAELRVRAAEGEAARQEHQRLLAQIGLTPRGPWKLRFARVVGRDPSTWWRTVRIDAGSRDGLQPNLPVMTSDGLVGRIASVGHSQSEVVLVGDAACGVATVVLETRDHGMVHGGQGTADLGEVEWNSLRFSPDLLPGQTVVTSGLGGIFPKGLVVGRILDVRTVDGGLYSSARLRLAANLNRLEEVWVLIP